MRGREEGHDNRPTGRAGKVTYAVSVRGKDRKQSEWMRRNASTDGMEMKITGWVED